MVRVHLLVSRNFLAGPSSPGRAGLAVACLLSLLLSCGTSNEGKPKARTSNDRLRETALAAIRAKADEQRQALVKGELDRHAERKLTFDASRLDDGDRRLLAKLLEAADVVEELNLLQANPRMLEFREQVQKQGTEDDRALFARNHGPWCLEGSDVRCCALRSSPAKEIGLHAWPKGFEAKLFSQLAKHPMHKVLLSPFTLVREVSGKLAATPMVKDELLGPRIKKLSQLLSEAAALAGEPSLKRFLASRAKALLSAAPFPYDDSDIDWIGIDGRWEVTVGPYETYRNPFRTKARFAMYIGLQDPETTKRLAAYGMQLQRMENALARLVGRRVYRGRKINRKTAIRAIELIRAAGDARRSQGAVVAYHLPNQGKGPEQGLTKKVILINHMRKMHELARARAELILAPDLRGLLSPETAVDNITFHEFCHGFGAYPTMPITVDGKETTVAAALGDHSLVLEELKAEALSLWLVEHLRSRRKLTRQEQKARYATALVRLVGLLQMDLRATHSKASAVLLGTLIKERAAIHDPSSGRWNIDFRRFPPALAKLTRKVATIQFKGDRAAAEKLMQGFVTVHGGAVTLVDNLELVRVGSRTSFAQAGIKPVTFTYHIDKLSAPPAPPKAKPAPKAKPVDKKAKPVDKKAKPVDKKAKPVDKKAKPAPAKPVDKKAKPKKSDDSPEDAAKQGTPKK